LLLDRRNQGNRQRGLLGSKTGKKKKKKPAALFTLCNIKREKEHIARKGAFMGPRRLDKVMWVDGKTEKGKAA